jgi:hypothetical protein
MKTLSRCIYRALLRLHPHSFRANFAEEMLWIFDEHSRKNRTLPLFLDALRSLALQHVIAHSNRDQPSSPLYREIDSAIPLRRFGHAGLIVLPVLAGLALLLSPWAPQPKMSSPFSTNHSPYHAHTHWLLTQIQTVSALNRPGT